jgi:pyrimidine operon attenuation protein/uracil phosphoribosyltransferase
MNEEKKQVLTQEIIEVKLQRMALEIAENISEDVEPLMLIGIEQNGKMIAEKLSAYVLQYLKVFVQILSVSFDKKLPIDIVLSENVSFDNKNIIVIDDVCNTGRTLMYALKPLLDFHPKRIQTLVLVERMHKLFPIKPNYVGLSLATAPHDYIYVETKGIEISGAYIATNTSF